MVAASLLAALPIISTSGWYPDFGYLVFISWRLLRADPWPRLVGRPLGFVNDLFTGYPIGFSMALWSATMLALDLIDRRTMWRDYWIEWVLAAVLIAIDEWLQWRVAELVDAAPAVHAHGRRRSSSRSASSRRSPGSSSRIDAWRLGR